MKTIKLYNLFHTYKNPIEINFDKFKLKITNEHCDAVQCIPQNKTTTYTHEINNNEIRPIIKEIPNINGTWANTAIIEINESDLLPSIVYVDIANKNIIHDFCLLCSFLGGRRVCTEEDRDCYNPKIVSDKVISFNDLIDLRDCWNKFNLLKKVKLGTQFYNLILSYENNEMISKFAYLNSAFDVIYSKWHKNNKSKYYKHDKNIIKRILNQLSERVKSSMFLSIKKILINLLKGSKYFGDKFIEDVSKRIGDKLHEKSFYLIFSFLSEMELIQNENEDILNRIKLINKIRNAMVHYGDLYKFDPDVLTQMQVTGAVSSIISNILQVYFAVDIFEINTISLLKKKEKIKIFFETGKYNGQDVFKESYEEYLKNYNDDFLSNI